jgi:DNA gyrase subunit A
MCVHHQVVLSTQRGTIVRQLVKDIPVQSRTATGVRVQRLDEGNSLLSVAVLPPEASGDQQGKAGKAKGEQRHAVEVGLVDGEGEEEPEEEGEEAAVGGV